MIHVIRTPWNRVSIEQLQLKQQIHDCLHKEIFTMRPNDLTKHAVAIFAAALGLAIGTNAMSATKEQQKMLDKASSEGFMAMRDIRWARAAIFSGHVNAATSFVEHAKQDLAKARKEAGKRTVTLDVKEQPASKGAKGKSVAIGDLISVDSAVMLSEDFTVTPEKKDTIAKANEHLKKGEVGKAIEVLRAADIGVAVTHILIPVNATEEHVDKAIELLKDQKYYEANLALKAAEDGAIIDTVIASEPAKVGAAKKKASEPEAKSEPHGQAEPTAKTAPAKK
jgi:acetolactate synthase small subunit